MKKNLAFLVIFVLSTTILLSGCTFLSKKSDDVLGVTSESIESRTLYNRISNNINRTYLESVFTAEEAGKQYKKVVLSEDAESVLEEINLDLAICEKCKELGIFTDYNEAKERAESEYTLLKSDNQSIYYNVLSQVIAEQGLSENEYLEMLYMEALYKYNRINLKNHFIEKICDQYSNVTVDQQFEEYLGNLK